MHGGGGLQSYGGQLYDAGIQTAFNERSLPASICLCLAVVLPDDLRGCLSTVARWASPAGRLRCARKLAAGCTPRTVCVPDTSVGMRCILTLMPHPDSCAVPKITVLRHTKRFVLGLKL